MFIDAGFQFGNPLFWPTTDGISNNTNNLVIATGDALSSLSSFLFSLKSQSSQKDKSQIYSFFFGGGG